MAGQTELYIKYLQEKNDPPVSEPFLAVLRRFLEPVDARFGHFDFVADEIKELYAGYNLYQERMIQNSTQNDMYHATITLSRTVGNAKPPLLSKIALKPAFLPANFLVLCLLARSLGWKLPYDLQSFAHKNNHLLQIIIREYPTLEYELPSDVIGLALSYMVNYEGGSINDEERPTLAEIDAVFERETNKFLTFFAKDLTRRSEALLKEYIEKNTLPGSPIPEHVSGATAHIYNIEEARDYAQKANLIEVYLMLLKYLGTIDHVDLSTPAHPKDEEAEPIMYTLASVNGIPPRHITTTVYPEILGKEAVLKKSREDAQALAAASTPLTHAELRSLAEFNDAAAATQAASAASAAPAAPAVAASAATTAPAAPAAPAVAAPAATTAPAASAVAPVVSAPDVNTSQPNVNAQPTIPEASTSQATVTPDINPYAAASQTASAPSGSPAPATPAAPAAGTPAATAAAYAANVPVATKVASPGNSVSAIKPTPGVSPFDF